MALWLLGYVTVQTGGVQTALWNTLVKSQTQAAYPVISVKQECLQQLLGYTGIVLVCSGYHSSIPSPGWLTQQTFIFSQFERLEVDEGPTQRASAEDLFLALYMATFSLCPPRVWSLLH